MKEKLRQVRFNLNRQNLTLGDLNFEGDEVLKERNGFFHRWGTELFYDSNNACFHAITIAIVEEDSGTVFQVSPKQLRFIK